MRMIIAFLFLTMMGASAVQAASAEELALWRSIENSQDARDYETYLRLYPFGDFAETAEIRATRLRGTSDLSAREASLRLSKRQRREVEERLSRAGFYPGSINGRFNRDTRLAIFDFRTAYGLPRHEFLDREMLRTLTRATGNEYLNRSTSNSRTFNGSRDGDVAAGAVAGALLLGGIILLAD
ncbi:MAG: peptidoglycan-binding domain-containing protein [Pseudomonadota bacterium]